MTARKAIKIIEWSMRSILYINKIDSFKLFKNSTAPQEFFNIKLEMFPILDNKIYQKVTDINIARVIVINLNLIDLCLDYSTYKMSYFLTVGTAPTAIVYFLAENKFYQSKTLINQYKDFSVNKTDIQKFLDDKQAINKIALENPFIEGMWSCAPEFWFKAVVETALANPSIHRYTLNVAASITFTYFNFAKYQLLQLEAMNLLNIFEQEGHLQDAAMLDTIAYRRSISEDEIKYEEKSGHSSIYSADEL